MYKISEHISYQEAVYSFTAKRHCIDNTPAIDHVKSMELVAAKVFEPLRAHVGGPIKVNSFYRCPELNRALGGSATSSHTKGEAIDIDDVYGYATNSQMFEYIKKNLQFDQLIWEFGNDFNPDWVHVSYATMHTNRNEVLRAQRVNNKIVYSKV